MLQNSHLQESDEQFEQWLQSKTSPLKRAFGIDKTNAAPSIIPVVVHVIHNGEPVGTGTNVSDAQIISQISVLNKDYQRLNSDANKTPAEFLPVAGQFNVQFVLAKQDPEGLATNGIVRVKGTRTSWAQSNDAVLKSMSYWDSNNYLNLWVTNLVDPNGLIGYAKFPVSTILSDLSNSPNDALTDGVVIHYTAFGSIDDGAFNLDAKFNKGRTATHEIGHFFGLYHIWGDDSGACTGTDYVDDTPNQGDSYNGQCPVHPKVSCGSDDMFQNYMDYTNDACMNIFTAGQVSRMVTVLQNSPRRVTLPTSKGATAPVAVAIDLGIKSILSPGTTACPGSNTPTIKVRNYGTSVVTSARIQEKVNSVVMETLDFTLNLSNLAETDVSFSALNLSAGSSNQISFEVIQVNLQTDENTNNNIRTLSFTTPQQASLPLLEIFNSTPANWQIQNPDGLTTWQNVSVPIDGTPNKAMYINLHGYEDEGAVDRLVSPVMDFSALQSASLKFDRAYAQYPSVTSDILRVLVSTNCGADLTQAVEIFNKSGTNLATASTTSNSFTPTTKSQWVTENLSLAQFKGNPNVQLFFEVQNGYGNNIFLDNVQVLISEIVDIGLVKINNPSPVVCLTDPSPSVTLQNLGSQTITSFKVASTTNGVINSQTFSNVSIIPGDNLTVTLNKLSLSPGVNTVRFTLSDPNSSPDARTDNDILELKCVVNSNQSGIPLREKFDSGLPASWTTVSQGTQQNYDITATNFGSSIIYPGYTNTSAGEQAWLVSPVLDLSRTAKASVFFDVSYGKNSTGNERLQVLASTDCGVTYPTSLFDQTGDSFSSLSSSSSWIPSDKSGWRNQFLYLDNLVGTDNARLAFITTNDHGNNLYLDNIEFFIDDNPTPVSINSLYKVYPADNSSSSFKVTFNLAEKSDAYLQVYDVMGKIIVDNILPETLNQTYTVDFTGQASGLYLVRVQTKTEFGTTKIFLTR